jgi:hypothetical protein
MPEYISGNLHLAYGCSRKVRQAVLAGMSRRRYDWLLWWIAPTMR